MCVNAVLRGPGDRAMVPAMSAPETAQATSTAPLPGPDFRHVRHWIFDLDNTLYDAHCGVFAQIERRMTDYVANFTGLPREEARALQKSLYRQHGTTLNGMMKLHGIAPDDYLSFVHDIDLSRLAPDASLTAAITRLPGTRTIFTNGCRHHAGRILSRIGLHHLFEDIWDIRTIGFTPKPDAAAYDMVVVASGLDPKCAAMFDDIPHNLLAARGLGMTTVWLNTGSEFSHGGPEAAKYNSHIDHETDNLTVFLHAIRI
jgi:putative hydrolase of the HAD superfamily